MYKLNQNLALSAEKNTDWKAVDVKNTSVAVIVGSLVSGSLLT